MTQLISWQLKISAWIDRAIASSKVAVMCSIALVGIPVVLFAYGIPWMAQWGAQHISVAMEDRLGQYILDTQPQEPNYMQQQDTTNPEAALSFYDDRVQTLAALAGLDGVTLHFRNGLPNAYALPGNRIVITYGLLSTLRNPNLVDGIIAHELGHLKRRDSLRMVLGSGLLAEMVMTFNGQSQGSNKLTTALANIFIFSHYTREQEAASDLFAVDLLIKDGQSPLLLSNSLQMLDDYYTKSFGAQAGKYTGSHPETLERIEAIKKATEAY
jgi:Zn-dependent protease with chaperone function